MSKNKDLMAIERIREERRVKDEERDNKEYQDAPLLYLKQRLKRQEDRIEELEKIIINFIIIYEKSSGEKNIFSRVLQE